MQQFELNVRGVAVRCWRAGEGPPLVLLHGSGPGACSKGAWAKVLDSLAAHYTVFMTDLAGFGESGRKAAQPYFDIDLWLAQAKELLGRVGDGPVRMIGHSISGYLALRLAGECREIEKLVTTGTMGTNFVCNDKTELCWTFPRTRDQLRRTLEYLIHDRAAITEAVLDSRMAILDDRAYGDYFSAMFTGAKQQYIEQATLSAAELAAVRCRVLMIHGMNDVMFPAGETTLVLANRLPQADVVLLNECGHLPAFEWPEKFLAFALPFLSDS